MPLPIIAGEESPPLPERNILKGQSLSTIVLEYCETKNFSEYVPLPIIAGEESPPLPLRPPLTAISAEAARNLDELSICRFHVCVQRSVCKLCVCVYYVCV